MLPPARNREKNVKINKIKAKNASYFTGKIPKRQDHNKV
jgi:hypothetical protein